MGKKNKQSKYDKLGYSGKDAANRMMAELYNINPDDYEARTSRRDNYRNKKSYEQFEKDIAYAATNNLNAKRAVELAKAAGNKKAEKLGDAYSTPAEAYAATRFLKKTHENRMDSGGDFASANDLAGTKGYWQNKVDSLTTKKDKPEAPKAPKAPEATKPFVLTKKEFTYSPDLQAAYDREDQRKVMATDASIPSMPAPVSTSSQSIADQYKTKIQKGLKPNLAYSLNNAAETLREQFMG